MWFHCKVIWSNGWITSTGRHWEYLFLNQSEHLRQSVESNHRESSHLVIEVRSQAYSVTDSSSSISGETAQLGNDASTTGALVDKGEAISHSWTKRGKQQAIGTEQFVLGKQLLKQGVNFSIAVCRGQFGTDTSPGSSGSSAL